MNPQPDQSVINLCSVGFVLLVIYFILTNKNTTNIFSNDLVDILYELEPRYNNYQYSTPSIQAPIKHASNKKQQKPKIQKIKHNTIPSKFIKPVLIVKNFTDLHNDCVNVLMSLGMKKRESTKLVIDVFTRYEISSIEDFIKKAFIPNEHYNSGT